MSTSISYETRLKQEKAICQKWLCDALEGLKGCRIPVHKVQITMRRRLRVMAFFVQFHTSAGFEFRALASSRRGKCHAFKTVLRGVDLNTGGFRQAFSEACFDECGWQ